MSSPLNVCLTSQPLLLERWETLGSFFSVLCKEKQYLLPQGSKEEHHVVLGQELVLALVPLRVPNEKSCSTGFLVFFSLANQGKALRRWHHVFFLRRRNILEKLMASTKLCYLRMRWLETASAGRKLVPSYSWYELAQSQQEPIERLGALCSWLEGV